MAISTIEEVQQWVKDSTITWRIDRTRPPKGQRVIFKVCLHCGVMLGELLGQKKKKNIVIVRPEMHSEVEEGYLHLMYHRKARVQLNPKGKMLPTN